METFVQFTKPSTEALRGRIRWGQVFGLVLLLGLVIALTGCGRGGPGGTYALHNQAGEVPGVRLVLRADGTFRQDGFPALEGRWERKDGSVVLRPETAGGRTAQELASERATQGLPPGEALSAETLLVEDAGKTLRPANGFGLFWRLKAGD